MLDINDATVVQIQIRRDSGVIWVNVNGVCALRVSGIKNLILDDSRKKIRKAKHA